MRIRWNCFTVIDHFKPDIIHIDEMSERLDREMIVSLYDHNRSYRIIETCHDVSFVPETKMFIPDAYAFCSPYHIDTFASLDGYKQVIEYPIEYNSWKDIEQDCCTNKSWNGYNKETCCKHRTLD